MSQILKKEEKSSKNEKKGNMRDFQGKKKKSKKKCLCITVNNNCFLHVREREYATRSSWFYLGP
jgi:hypothetical protein